jgi:hypothetical protein
LLSREGAGATVDSAAEWFVEDRVAVDVATWNSKAITPWDGVGFFPGSHSRMKSVDFGINSN